MSIETLLEAAKFLELQAEQQQKTRGKKDCSYETLRARAYVCAKVLVQRQGTLFLHDLLQLYPLTLLTDGSYYDFNDCQNYKKGNSD